MSEKWTDIHLGDYSGLRPEKFPSQPRLAAEDRVQARWQRYADGVDVLNRRKIFSWVAEMGHGDSGQELTALRLIKLGTDPVKELLVITQAYATEPTEEDLIK